MPDNGAVEPNGDNLPWRLPKSKAVECDASMRARIQEKLVKSAYDELMMAKSWRIAFAGHYYRNLMASAAVETLQAGGDRAMFREKCKGYGVPLVVIVLLLGIIWDVIFEWWKRRNPKDY
jgi:hypothetical protein